MTTCAMVEVPEMDRRVLLYGRFLEEQIVGFWMHAMRSLDAVRVVT